MLRIIRSRIIVILAAAGLLAAAGTGIAAAAGSPVTGTFAAGYVHSGTVPGSQACLDSNWNPVNAHPVYLYRCGSSGGVNQQVAYDGKTLYFVNSGNHWCLSDLGTSASPDQVIIESCTPGSQPADQQVTYDSSTDTYAFQDGKVLDDKAFAQANTTPVIAFAANGGLNQDWSAPFR